MSMPPPYRAPWWLPDPHSQTLWPLLQAPALPALRRERRDTPDGDFIDIDWLDGGATSGGADRAPLLLIFHGLEGSSRSHYARALLQAAAKRGWRAVVAHFRGCGGTPNRLARAYHAGDSAEIDWIVSEMQLRAGSALLFAAGVSLGGNALLKWLGEQGGAARGRIRAAAAIGAPLDLAISGAALDRGLNRAYTWHFLRSLKTKALAKCAAFGGRFDAPRIAQATTLREFDDAYTAPAHGFVGVDDYWQRASSRPLLRDIEVPTLLLNADNDPFVPLAALPQDAELATAVLAERTQGGGHVGFFSARGNASASRQWLGERVLAHFDLHA